MCSHTYTHFSNCPCVAIHTHQCYRTLDPLKVIFCDAYETVRREIVGLCPNHERIMRDALRMEVQGSSGVNTRIGSSVGSGGSESS